MKLKKILKDLDKDTIESMDALDEAALKNDIALSEEAIASAVRARDAMPEYAAAKQAVSDLSTSVRELKKRQNAKIAYALRRLRALAGEDLGDEE